MEDKKLYPEFRCDMCNQYQDNGCDLETGMCDKCSDTLRKTFYYKTMQQELSIANDKLKKIEKYIEVSKEQITTKYSNEIPKEILLMDFLKKKGYRPKPTAKYMLGLIRRLKKQNKMLIFSNWVDYNYKKQDASNNLVIEGTLKMIAKIKDIENEFDKEFVKNQIKNLKGKRG